MKTEELDFIKKLITIPSTQDNTEAIHTVLQLTKNELSNFSVEAFTENNVPSLLFFTAAKKPEKFSIILNAHLDVVPGKKEQFNPQIIGNKLIGRGSYDMKAAATVMIFTFKKLASSLPYPLALQIVTDEEVGGTYGTKYQLQKGVHGEFVIAGEKTDLQINNESKGIVWLKLKTIGKTAHGAYLWDGDNAIWKMKRNLDSIAKLYPTPKTETWTTTVNLANISSTNTTINKVPDACEALFDIRYIPADKDLVIKTITSKLVPGSSYEVLMQEPEHFANSHSTYMKKLSDAIEKNTGKKASFIKKHGGSDVRFYTQKGIDGVTFGPCGEGLHSDNEWVDIDSLDIYQKTLETFLQSINS